MQSRQKSLLEIFTSTCFGFIISMVASQIYYHEQSWARNIGFTVIMTGVSLARGYAWRRFFNWLDRKRDLPANSLVFATYHPGEGAMMHIATEGNLTRSAAIGHAQIINIAETLIKSLREYNQLGPDSKGCADIPVRSTPWH
jgi:membrane protease YdiL (CAAX protease family)